MRIDRWGFLSYIAKPREELEHLNTLRNLKENIKTLVTRVMY